jgi:hypothetical protein
VLRNFYLRTLPFGFWNPFGQELPQPLARRVSAEHRRELAALPLALLFQVAIFLTHMLALIRNWGAFAACGSIAACAFTGLYVVWLRRIDESDVIIAEAKRRVPVRRAANLARHYTDTSGQAPSAPLERPQVKLISGCGPMSFLPPSTSSQSRLTGGKAFGRSNEDIDGHKNRPNPSLSTVHTDRSLPI